MSRYLMVLTLATVFCTSLPLHEANAQAPDKISYQAVVRNSDGTLVYGKAVGMKISILQGSPSGTLVYEETYNPVPQTNANGLVTVEIGSGNPSAGIFSSIDWSTGPYFLKTETDPAGGTNYTISGTSQLLSVPYALNAKIAETYAETDPLFTASGISGTSIGNWNTAFAWGNHAQAGYISKAYVDAMAERLVKTGVIVVDSDGNFYSTVKIGLQTWMSENLKTTKYNDGTPIPLVSSVDFYGHESEGYCWYMDQSDYGNTYGALYNWYVVNTGRLCPGGWHVPSETEWMNLISYLGEVNAGGKLKETGTTHWQEPNTGATNESGFYGLPGGRITHPYELDKVVVASEHLGSAGYWWTSSQSFEDSPRVARSVGLIYNSARFFFIGSPIDNALSVRCLKNF